MIQDDKIPAAFSKSTVDKMKPQETKRKNKSLSIRIALQFWFVSDLVHYISELGWGYWPRWGLI